MAKRRTIQITSAILCDQVRVENNNKFIIIGVYSGEVVVSALPALLHLSAYFEILGLSIGEHEFILEMQGPTGESVGIQGGLIVSEDLPAAIFTPPMPVPCPSAGEVVVNVTVSGESFDGVIRRRIKEAAPGMES